MKPSSSNFLCLVSVIILILVSSINAEYEWNGKEWIWKETPTNADVGSGDYPDEDVNEDRYSSSDDDEDDDDEDYYEGSGDDSSYGIQNKNPPPSSNNGNTNLNNYERDNYDGSRNNVQITPAPDVNMNNQYPENGERDWEPDNRNNDIIVDSPQTTYASPIDIPDNNNIPDRKTNFGTKSPTSFFAQPGTMAAVIGGAVVGLLCAILCVMFVVYRMRKKDEGSYALDEPKRSPTVNSYSKPPSREFYA